VGSRRAAQSTISGALNCISRLALLKARVLLCTGGSGNCSLQNADRGPVRRRGKKKINIGWCIEEKSADIQYRKALYKLLRSLASSIE